MQKEKYFKIVDELFDEYIGIWQDVCNIESPTWFKEGIDNCCDYFVNRAKNIGCKTEKYPQTEAGDPACITLNPDASGRPISFSGHIDTVHPVGSFGEPAVHIDDEKIYGPGVCDCKGGVVSALLAIEALSRGGFTDRPVQLLLQTDEEGGAKYSDKANIKWICEKAKDTAAFINLEDRTERVVCIARKGIVNYKFKITGIEAHSSLCARYGANAIIEAAHKMLELDKLKDHDGITCSTNIIKGGVTHNVVAGYCEFTCDMRFSNAEQLEWIETKVKDLANTVFVEGCTTEVMRSSFRNAMELTEKNKKLADDINNALEKHGFGRLKPIKSTGGSDAADATVFGLPTVDALGVEGGSIHSLDEFAKLESLRRNAKELIVIALEIY